MKKIWLTNSVAIGMLLVSANAFAQQKNELSVKQTVEYSNKNSITVKNALLDIEVQQQANRQITSAAFPQVSGNISTNHYFDIPVTTLPDFISPATYQVLIDQGVKNGSGQPITMPAGGFGSIPAQFGTSWNASGSIDVSQLLFDGQVFVGLQARKTSIDARVKAAEVTQESIKANIYKIYYQLVVSKTQVDLLNANIERLQKLEHDTREIYKNGLAEKVDIDKLTVQLANLETEKLKALNSIANGYSGLKVLMGMPVKENLVLTDTLSENEIKENILEASNYQYSDRKEYQLLELNNKLNAYNVKRYKLSQVPTLSFNANYSKELSMST